MSTTESQSSPTVETNGMDPARTSDEGQSPTSDSEAAPSGQRAEGPNAGAGGDDATTFIANLVRAMHVTASAERVRISESAEQRRQAHIQGLGAREASEAEDFRHIAERDIEGINAWAEGEIARLRLQREERIAARRAQLQTRLEQHHAQIEREIQVAEAAVSAYRADLDRFFSGLEAQSDPVAIAHEASARPTFPALDRLTVDDSASASVFARVVGDAGDAAPPTQAPQEEARTDVPGTVGEERIPMVGVMGPPANSSSDEMSWQADAAVEGEPALEASAEVVEQPAESEEQRESRTVAGVLTGESASSRLRAARADRLLGSLLGRGSHEPDRHDSEG